MSWWASNDLISFATDIESITGFNMNLIMEQILWNDEENYGMYMIMEDDPEWENLVNSISDKLIKYNNEHYGVLEKCHHSFNEFCKGIQNVSGLNWLKVRNVLSKYGCVKNSEINLSCLEIEWDEDGFFSPTVDKLNPSDMAYVDYMYKIARKLIEYNVDNDLCLAGYIKDFRGKPIVDICGYST